MHVAASVAGFIGTGERSSRSASGDGDACACMPGASVMRRPASSPRAADWGQEPLSAAIWRVSGHGHSSAGLSVVHRRHDSARGQHARRWIRSWDKVSRNLGALGPARSDGGEAAVRCIAGTQGRYASIAGARSHGRPIASAQDDAKHTFSLRVRFRALQQRGSLIGAGAAPRQASSSCHLKAVEGARQVATASAARASDVRPGIRVLWPLSGPALSQKQKRGDPRVSALWMSSAVGQTTMTPPPAAPGKDAGKSARWR